MDAQLDKRRIAIFLGFAFGIAWLTGLAVYLTGGLTHSPQIGGVLPLSLILLAGPYMWAPAIANILTRLITREGWGDAWLRPHFRRSWPFLLLAWFLPGLLTLAGGAIFYLVFPQYLDFSFPLLQAQLDKAGVVLPISVGVLALIQLIQGFLLAPINIFATFGEEFGWRGYLLQKLQPLGMRKALVCIGAIWGIWHWPIIFMGYEYGFEYPGFPWLGPLLFLWITFIFGVLLAWLTWRGKSVWPAVMGHAAINAIAGVSVLPMKGAPISWLGPSSVGLIGSLGFAVMAVLLFWRVKSWVE